MCWKILHKLPQQWIGYLNSERIKGYEGFGNIEYEVMEMQGLGGSTHPCRKTTEWEAQEEQSTHRKSLLVGTGSRAVV